MIVRSVLAQLIRLVTGVRRIEDSTRGGAPRIYYANHSSHLDFVVIWAALPARMRERTRPVAAADYWNAGPIRRWLAKHVFQAVLISRGKVTRADNPICGMTDAIAAGHDLILFPEGTRSLDGQVAEFRSGLHALIHQAPHVELMPVFLENLNRILPKGEFLMVPLMGSARFGSSCPGPQSGETRKDFLARARLVLLELSPPDHPSHPTPPTHAT